MEREKIRELALDLKFDVSEEEISVIEKEFVSLEKMLKDMEGIDTAGVEEMIYPFVCETSYLREDEPDHVISQEEAIANGSKVKAGHFVVPKVVK